MTAAARTTNATFTPSGETSVGYAPRDLLAFLQEDYQALAKVCLRWSRGNASDAADLLSMAIVKVLESRPGLAAIDCPRAWWSKVIANLARDIHRRVGRAALPLTEALDIPSGMDAHRSAVAREAMAQLWRRIDRLPQAQRDALLLKAAGHPYRHIAAMLGVSVESARKLVQFGREALRDDEGEAAE